MFKPCYACCAADQLLQQLTPSMADHSSSDCRQQYFETLRTAWQLRPAMHAVLRPALLAMLGDSNAALRAEALGFWDSAMPKHVGQRLQALLQDSLTEPGNLVCTSILPSCKHRDAAGVSPKRTSAHSPMLVASNT